MGVITHLHSKGRKVNKHKLHRISNHTLVILDEALVKALGLDQFETWVDEILTNDGILLRFQRESGPDV